MPPCKSAKRGYEEGVAAPRRELAEEHWAEWLLVPLDTGNVEEVANLELILWRVWLDRNKVTQAGESLSITGSVEFLMQLQEYEVGRSERRRGLGGRK
jgi:hypothetical protein